jgi:ribose 5-phosphate isomerase A
VSDDRDQLKRAAALRAIEEVQDGMVVGLGTGSTAAHVVEGLAARVAAGLRVVGIPTSERTAAQARRLGIPIATFAEHQRLDLTIDGADEVQLGTLELIKGLGGALLREKIVAMASKRMIVIADSSKSVAVLGKCPLPVEVNVFGLEATKRMILAAARACGCDGDVRLRKTPGGHAFVSDNGHYIVDCFFGAIADPDRLADRLAAIPGIVEHGLFIGIAKAVISAGPAGIEILGQLD